MRCTAAASTCMVHPFPIKPRRLRCTHSGAAGGLQPRLAPSVNEGCTQMSQLKPAAQRVQDVLRAKGLEADVRHMPASTRTAQEAADACGCAGRPDREVADLPRSPVGQAVSAAGFRRQPCRRDRGGAPDRRAPAAAPTRSSCGRQPGLPSAASRRSATPRRSPRSWTRHCSATRSSGPPLGRPMRSSRSHRSVSPQAIGARTIRVIPDPGTGS